MNTQRESVVMVNELVKQYPSVRAVDGISFDVQQGEIFGLLGPNGAGKTTTIECIEGLRRGDAGSIRVLGLDPHRESRRLREQIGIQFQSAALPDRLKVWEALDLFAAFYRKPVDWRSLLEKMGLEEKRDTFLAKLSGGQKQRVFIALALINDPSVVFLDELTTGLDPQSRRAMWEMVQDIRSRGTTVFLTTHFMEEAERLCDRVAIIDRGRIVALDTPQKLIAALKDEGRVVFEVKGPTQPASLGTLAGVSRVETLGERWAVYGQPEGLIGRVAHALEAEGIRFDNLHTEQPTLEDVFLKLTGKALRN